MVRTGEGKPGDGLTTVDARGMDQMRESVFQHNWYDSLPPTVQELEAEIG